MSITSIVGRRKILINNKCQDQGMEVVVIIIS